jgi:hypothetical protein
LRDLSGKPVLEVVQVKDQRDLSDPSLYAPALPGLIVAILGLWVAHWLTIRRERRKDLFALCDALEKLVEEAVAASNLAWTSPAGQARIEAVHDTRWKTQKVGAAATRLLRQTQGPLSDGIDMITHAAHFRDVLTEDPFMDPGRAADPSRVAGNHGALSSFMAQLNYLRDIVLA